MIEEIKEGILNAFRAALENELEIEIQNAKDKLESMMPEIMSRVTMQCMKRIRLERIGSELVIYIQFEEGGKDV